MNTRASPVRYLVLRCDVDGTVSNVVRDDFGVVAGKPGTLTVAGLVAAGSREKALEFLMAARRRGFAGGWELAVEIPGPEIHVLQFMGFPSDGKLVIAGTETHQAVIEELNEMSRVGNEHQNTLRKVLKEIHTQNGLRQQMTTWAMHSATAVPKAERRPEQTTAASNPANSNRESELWKRFLGLTARDLRDPSSGKANSGSGFSD